MDVREELKRVSAEYQGYLEALGASRPETQDERYYKAHRALLQMMADKLIKAIDRDIAREDDELMALIENQKEYVKIHFDPS